MKCKECPYLSKEEIHGHGERFKECKYMDELLKQTQINLSLDNPNRIFYLKDSTKYIRDDEDECLFISEISFDKI